MKIIQYSAINPKHGKIQHYLKEVTEKKYNQVYLPAVSSGKIFNLEVLEF